MQQESAIKEIDEPIDDRQYMIAENVSSDGHIRIRIRISGIIKTFII